MVLHHFITLSCCCIWQIGSVHEGKKPFRCEVCDYSCTEKRNMIRHISLVHEGKKNKCDICNKKFVITTVP